jgi:hypothetical protein
LDNLIIFYCYGNRLTLLGGIEILIKLINSEKYIKYYLKYSFIDSYDHVELKDLFNNLIKCKNNDKINKYIKEIEKMFITLNGFHKYILK